MRHIADKPARQLLQLCQVVCHIIKGDRQLVNFLTAAVLGHPHAKIPRSKFLRRARHGFQRPGHAPRYVIRKHQRRNQRHQHHKQRRIGKRMHHIGNRRAVRCHKNQRRHIALVVAALRADRVAVPIEHAERPHFGVIAHQAHPLRRARADLYRAAFADPAIVRPKAHRAVWIRDNDCHAVFADRAHQPALIKRHGILGRAIQNHRGLVRQVHRGAAQLPLRLGEHVTVHLVKKSQRRRHHRYQDQHGI